MLGEAPGLMQSHLLSVSAYEQSSYNRSRSENETTSELPITKWPKTRTSIVSKAMRSLFVIAIIRLTRFRYARGMVFGQYYRCRVVV
jgi:hypothetical protein